MANKLTDLEELLAANACRLDLARGRSAREADRYRTALLAIQEATIDGDAAEGCTRAWDIAQQALMAGAAEAMK